MTDDSQQTTEQKRSENVVGAITLFERESGERSMKYGRYDDKAYLDGEVKIETATVVELDEPVASSELNQPADFPQEVRDFFGVVTDEH
jgi:hypothetical protein